MHRVRRRSRGVFNWKVHARTLTTMRVHINSKAQCVHICTTKSKDPYSSSVLVVRILFRKSAQQRTVECACKQNALVSAIYTMRSRAQKTYARQRHYAAHDMLRAEKRANQAN